MSSQSIHPTAIVSSSAKLGEGTTVGAFSIIGPDVVIGANNVVRSHVVIEGRTRIGDENIFYQFSSIGAAPQDLKYHGEPSELHIGSHNIIRECVTLQPGTEGGIMRTSIGDHNLFMANTHVGHDSIVGSRCVIANGAALAGHVTLGSGVIVGGLSGIHQFVRLGDVSMIGAGAMVAQDIPPYCMAQGDRATIQGLNRIGLERNGGTREDLATLREIYRIVFTSAVPEVQGKVFKERVAYSRTVAEGCQRALDLVAFLESSDRGVASHHKMGNDDVEG